MHANRGTKSNARLITVLSLVVVGMFGFGFALVPLYSVFCELTGLNGKTGRIAAADAESLPVDKHRTVTIEFVTSLNQNMNLEFRANQTKLHIHPGELYTTSFYARNRTGHYMVGRAIPSVAPGLAALHLEKTECFCFRQQPFKPGEGRNMPVTFVVDSELPEDIKTITLSYTFFDVTQTAALAPNQP